MHLTVGLLNARYEIIFPKWQYQAVKEPRIQFTRKTTLVLVADNIAAQPLLAVVITRRKF